MSLSKTLSRIPAKFTHTLTGHYCSVVIQPTLSVKCSVRAMNVKRPACSLHPLWDEWCCPVSPRPLQILSVRLRALSDTFFLLASTDSQPHNLSTHPSNQYSCYTARTPMKHLLRRFFLIRRISPVSNSPLLLDTPLPCFRLRACLITFYRLGQIGALQGWRGGKAMGRECGRRVDVVGRKGQHAFFGGVLEAHDVGRCYWGYEDRGQQDLDHSGLNQSKQIPLYSPDIIAAPPLLSLCIRVCTQKPWGKVLTLSTLRRT